jgi:divalent metal cation (Fe/Co/Zn/Cd) transporter
VASVDLQRRAIRLEYLTIAWNSAEAVVALIAGFLAGSVALIGFGLDSLIEVFAASVVLWQLRGDVSDRREGRALKLIALSFYALALYVTVEAVRDLVVQARPEESIAGIGLTVVSLLIMGFLSRAKHRAGHDIGSWALIADSKETLLCSYLSGVVLVGLALNALLGWWWADPVAGLGIGILAVREGREAWHGEHPGEH